jgi:hypothetical protein
MSPSKASRSGHGDVVVMQRDRRGPGRDLAVEAQEVHGRRADEAGHEQRRGLVVDVLRRAELLDTPWFITTILSPICIASSWSWVT